MSISRTVLRNAKLMGRLGDASLADMTPSPRRSPRIHGQEWAAYGGDGSGQQYSAAAEITAKNVSKLKLAWQYGIDPGGSI